MFSPEKYVCWQALQQGITLMPLENVQGGDMPGDTAHISAPVCRRVEKLLPHLVTKLEEKYGTDIHGFTSIDDFIKKDDNSYLLQVRTKEGREIPLIPKNV